MIFLHIIKSTSYDSDGRLQKWLKQIRDNNGNSSVLCVEDSNCVYEKCIDKDIIISKKLFFRNYFKQRKGYFFKIIEYFFLVNEFINKTKFDVIVFHDVQQYLNLTYFLIKNSKRQSKVIWDLHELPHDFLFRFYLTRKWLSFIISNVDVVVYTNSQRRDYILERLKSVKERSFFILNNFPSKSFIISPKSSAIENKFKNNRPYLLWLGMATKGRNFDVFFQVYKKISNEFNLVILGKIGSEFEEDIKQFESEGILFNEFVNQSEIIKYIDNCYYSVILYNGITPNNFFCEPNRLYQLISRNIPVIVGNNPVMRDIVGKYNLGYVLDDDGSNEEELLSKMNLMKMNYKGFKEASSNIEFDKILSWEMQFQQIIEKVSK